MRSHVTWQTNKSFLINIHYTDVVAAKKQNPIENMFSNMHMQKIFESNNKV